MRNINIKEKLNIMKNCKQCRQTTENCECHIDGKHIQLKDLCNKLTQRSLIKDIMKADETDGLYDETFNTKEK